MKYLKNITLTEATEDTPAVTHAGLVKAVLERPPQGGFGIVDIRKRLRILDKLNDAEDVIAFEDAEAELVQQCVQSHRWPVIHADIVTFCDSVETMTDQRPE